MNDATALTEPEEATTRHRRREAGNANKRLLLREVHDLEAIQPFQRLERHSPLHTDARGEICEIEVEAAGMLLDRPSEATGEERCRRPKVLGPHLLDVPVAQSPPILSARRQRNYVQGHGI